MNRRFIPSTQFQVSSVYARLNRATGGQAAVGAGVGAGAVGAGVAVGLAATGAGLSATGVGAVVGIPLLATAGIVAATERLIRTKEEKLKAALKNVSKYKLNYLKCKGRREKKGKEAYPQDASKGLFASNCHKDYKKWKDAERLVAENAKKVKDKLKGKGKLTPELADDLDLMQEMPAITATYEQMQDEDKCKRKKCKNKPSKGMDYSGEEEPSTDYTVPIVLGLGALILLGGGAFFLTRPKKPVTPPTATSTSA